MKAPRLAPGSLLTTADQIALYEEQKGKEAAERQVRLARIENKQCICRTRSVKRRWMDSDKATTRKVHDVTCPKWKTWMAEVNSDPHAES